MSESYRINPTNETIIVRAEEIHATYGQSNGTEYVSLYIRDPLLGELFIPFGLPAAAETIANMVGILGNIDTLRTRWTQNNPSSEEAGE
ncbi:MAG: hypothetical protein KDB71_07080 [Mycobacterium sp.]|nr:hypothetical protein [Mycobacterium sp.]